MGATGLGFSSLHRRIVSVLSVKFLFHPDLRLHSWKRYILFFCFTLNTHQTSPFFLLLSLSSRMVIGFAAYLSTFNSYNNFLRVLWIDIHILFVFFLSGRNASSWRRSVIYFLCLVLATTVLFYLSLFLSPCYVFYISVCVCDYVFFHKQIMWNYF